MIYIASSWRNEIQPVIVDLARGLGHKVYDFRDSDGFHWSEVDPTVEVQGFAEYTYSATKFEELLHAPQARRGFARDMAAVKTCDTLILVLPCGRSAHLELGMAVGFGKRTIIYLDDPCLPELMYRAVDYICHDMHGLVSVLGRA